MKSLIIDYGMGNLGSVRRAFEENGASVQITSDPEDVNETDLLILPGVGSFYEGMERLRKGSWDQAIHEFVKTGKPFVGICLGMQLMATSGFEGSETQGLNLIPGQVKKLRSQNLRIPHVGWNEVYPQQVSGIFNGIPEGTDFYFVHSYEFLLEDQAYLASKTPYGIDFVSSIQRENILGFQFHPEKSQRPGFHLIKNILGGDFC